MSAELTLEQALETIAAARTDEVAVLTMSALALPDPLDVDFRLVGQMGAAASIGLGVAIGRPDRAVWVLDGDGSLLMALGVLAAVGDAAPPRFVHIVMANGVYAISGGQPVPEIGNWEQLAMGSGYRSARTCVTAGELTAALGLRDPGPRMVIVRCRPGAAGVPSAALTVDPSDEAGRVRSALGHADNRPSG